MNIFFSARAPGWRATSAMNRCGAWCGWQPGILAAAAICCFFPKAPAPTSRPVNPLQGSIGLIARHAQVPVQTVLIETDSLYLSKGWPLFRKPPMPIHYRARLGGASIHRSIPALQS